uniref:Calponin-homology (CH) domain-containing protein n=1 Tax=Haptolina brevifila TaxID=156173 RepID=A0A7S2JDX6_9EUKA
MAKINLKASPELIQLLPEVDDMEALRAFLALPPEKVLLKWLNYQVQRVAPDYKEVTNFGPALKDSRVYAHLLTAVAPKHNLSAVQGLTAAVAQTADPLAKAQLIIEAAHELGVREFKVFAGDITKGNEKLNMGFMAAIFNHLPGLTAPSQYGTFGSSLAHASAIIKESGHAVRLTKDGCALFGPALMKGTGAHWVELRVLEASGGCFMGMASPAGDCASAPGHAAGSVGLSRTGELWSNRAVAQPDCSGGFSIGDLIRIEYDANRQVLAFTTNGVLHANVAGGMHFGVGLQGGGALEVRIENSSFTAGSNLVALPVEDDGDSREERAFRIWINSLGLDTHVSDLPSQVRDGLLLLQLMEAIKPGVADWTKVTTKPKNVHAKVINCNYAVALGKSAFGFSLVGISGKDIQDGITKLVLAVTWQLMRYHVIKFLSSLSHKQLTEKDVVDWANARVGGGALPAISKLSDASISSGVFVCHLVKAVAPRSVDLSQVSEGKTAEEKKLNARLAVSCARKAGCMVFLLWEDIVECKPKMLLILFASLMQLEISDKASKRTVEDVRT